MILADKIIQLRKKYGLSQEELAEKMGVSRQAVCKWEGAQSVPGLNKIVMLSHLFHVSTDYLLKDEIEDDSNEIIMQDTTENIQERNVHYVSLEEAVKFLTIKEEIAGKIAAGVCLCVFSPSILFLLFAMIDLFQLPYDEDIVIMLGISFTIVMIAIAVVPLMVGAYIFTDNESIRFLLDSATFFMLGIGISLLIKVGIPWRNMNKILKER